MKAILSSRVGLGQEAWDRFKAKLFQGRSKAVGVSLQLVDMPEPVILSSKWVKVRTIMSAISDMDSGMVNSEDPAAFGAYVSYPFVPGNEVLGIVTDAGEEVSGIELGERVVLNPLLSCGPRGIEPPCACCAAGNPSSCLNFTKGILSPGIVIGACKDTSGGWADYFLAHESQIRPLPQTMESDQGILIPEFARALRAVLQHRPSSGEKVIIVGGGSLGLLTLLAFKILGHDGRLLFVTDHVFEAEIARSIGQKEIVAAQGPAETYEAVADMFEGTVRYPEFGRIYMEGGADLVYETTGKRRNIEDALRFAAEGKKLVLMGLNEPSGFDTTPLWFKNIRIVGTAFSGQDNYNGEVRNTFDIALDLATRHGLPQEDMITHRFRLEQFQEALEAAADPGASAAVKVIFQHVF